MIDLSHVPYVYYIYSGSYVRLHGSKNDKGSRFVTRLPQVTKIGE